MNGDQESLSLLAEASALSAEEEVCGQTTPSCSISRPQTMEQTAEAREVTELPGGSSVREFKTASPTSAKLLNEEQSE